MIDISQYADALKLRLPYKNNSVVDREKVIQSISIANQEVFLTIPSHEIQSNENYWSVYGIKYKYPIKSIQKQPNIRYNGVERKCFIVDIDSINPVIYSDTTLTISGVLSDTNYNGTFTILNADDLGQKGTINQFILITDNDSLVQNITNEGFLLYEITDSSVTKNALNGRKQISVIDENTVKYSINSAENKYEWVVDDFDISSAKIGQVQVIFTQSEESIDTYIAGISENSYSIFITTPNVSGSTGGVLNTSSTVQTTGQRFTRIERDVYFRVIVMSPRADMQDSLIGSKYTELYRQASEIFCGVEHVIITTAIELPEYLNLAYNSTTFAMFTDFNQYKVYQNNARASWVMDFKLKVFIDPRSFPAYTMSVPLKTISMTDKSKEIGVNYNL